MGYISFQIPRYIIRMDKEDLSSKLKGSTCSEDDSDDSDYNPEEKTLSGKKKNLNPLSFDITINKKKWEQIKPSKKVYKDGRVYDVLQRGWTDVMAKEMWKESKLQCSYKFRNHHFYKTSGYDYLYFDGFCTDDNCGVAFMGSCKEQPSTCDEVLKIRIDTYDTRKIKHKNKRRFAGPQRAKGKKKLRYMKAKAFKGQKANKLLDNSDLLPAILSNSYVYQKARQEARDAEIELYKYPGNPIESLHAIMDSGTDIQMIATTPFQVMYWTGEQLKLWKEALEMDDVVASVDASGSFVKKVNIFEDNISPAIFLYILVVRFNGKMYAVSQMLSAAHDTNSISNWLLRHKEDSKIIPQVLISDCALALLNSSSLTYNDCTYDVFLTMCLRILQKKKCSTTTYFASKRSSSSD